MVGIVFFWLFDLRLLSLLCKRLIVLLFVSFFDENFELALKFVFKLFVCGKKFDCLPTSCFFKYLSL